MSNNLVRQWWATGDVVPDDEHEPADAKPTLSKRDKRICEMFLAAESQRAMMAELHVCAKTVRKVLRSQGLLVDGVPTPARLKRERDREARHAAIVSMYTEDSAITTQEIADCFGIVPETVCVALKAAGVKITRRFNQKDKTPCCKRCGIPTEGGEQLTKAAKKLGICDYCLSEIKLGRLCEIDELDNKMLKAAMSASISADEAKAARQRFLAEAMRLEAA